MRDTWTHPKKGWPDFDQDGKIVTCEDENRGAPEPTKVVDLMAALEASLAAAAKARVQKGCVKDGVYYPKGEPCSRTSSS